MTDLRAILAAAPALRAAGCPALLATVVRTRGSTYRKAGARMLLGRDGSRLGTVSGGCVEADLIETAWERVDAAGGRPIVVEYDTERDGDIVWGHGSGCAGTVEILLETLPVEEPPAEGGDLLAFLDESLRARRSAVVATVVRTNGGGGPEFPVRVGDRLLLRGGEMVVASDADLRQTLLGPGEETLRAGKSRWTQAAGGALEVFCEYVPPPPALVVFGTGQDALPVVRLARELGWHVTVAGRRGTLGAGKALAAAADAFVPEAEGVRGVDGETLALVMTHQYLTDLGLLAALLPREPRYLGLLGPSARRDKLLHDLARDTGFRPTSEQLARFHAPAGLDVGAEGPGEIALAIVAEMRAVLAGRPGGALRDRSPERHGV